MPDTWFDLPFFYVFNGNTLLDGAKYDGLSIPVQDDAEFIARAIHGISTVGRLADLIDENGRRVFRGPAAQISEPILLHEPLRYSPGSVIRFSLTNTSRLSATYSNSQVEYRAKIVFAGVKRFRGAAAEQLKSLHYPESMKSYRRQYFVWAKDYTVNWYGKQSPGFTQAEPARNFQFEIDDRGLEVYACQWVGSDGQLLTGNQIEVMPYDLSNRALANDYVPVHVLNYSPGMEHRLFPMAPLYWPPQSMVSFGIRSVMTNTASPFPLTFRLSMYGARRIPC